LNTIGLAENAVFATAPHDPCPEIPSKAAIVYRLRPERPLLFILESAP